METKRSETVISRFLVFFSYRLHILYQSIKEELMDQFNVYKDMKARTNGEIYIGANRKEYIYQTFYESDGIAKYRR